MKQTEQIARFLLPEIEGKRILEVACGTGDFSLAAAHYAVYVDCIDIDPHRLNSRIAGEENISFQQMDAGKMNFSDEAFDSVVLYNALFHIKDQWAEVLAECRRVLKSEGKILIVGTWKLDTSLMEEMFGDQVDQQGAFSLVEIIN